jgi:hypothetical protein
MALWVFADYNVTGSGEDSLGQSISGKDLDLINVAN